MILARAMFISILAALFAFPAQAQTCTAVDRACLLDMLEETAGAIEKDSWRNQTYREMAKTLAFEGDIDRAIGLIERITSPDTQAMTIRGIGMAAADNKLPQEDYDIIFGKLHEAAKKIDHDASHAIALTYIAMAQAFAGDDKGATETAKAMENDSLRNKAFGESAEIQAERGDLNAALASIAHIDDPAFRNKAHRLIAKILAKNARYEDALQATMKIDNAYMKAETLQFILDQQKPREVEKHP